VYSRFFCCFVAASLLANLALSDEAQVLKVFILAGQSNMEGKAKLTLLNYQAAQPATAERFARFRAAGDWTVREDVWIKFLDRQGPLTIGFGSPGCIGPELAFGFKMGDRFREPVLLIKTAWGGRSLYRDFRSPSAGLPNDEVLAEMLKREQVKHPEKTLDDIKAPFGASYRTMLKEVQETLAHPENVDQKLEGLKPELAGLAWFQGWNDMIDAKATAEYADNLAHFVRDVRKDLAAPHLPIAVAQMGVDGERPNDNIHKFKEAQAAGVDRDEFRGNVALVKTDLFWDTDAEAVFKKGWRENLEEWNKVGSDYPYHYLGSPRTLCAVGDALADALLSMETADR
jgi:alpha-galactosidase